MSPDIQWHIGDETSQDTIVKTPPRPPSRWRGIVIGIVVMLGAGLGVLYHSIPQPPAPPTSIPAVMTTPAVSPTPTPLPPPGSLAESIALESVIDREAQALADGDLITFLSIQDQRDGRWVQSQIKSFQAWGRPLANMGPIAFLSRPLYTIVKSGTLSPDRAWADVIQFHNEQYFRGTRFYRQTNGQWLRIRPNLSFWSDQYQSLQTKHFEVIYPVEDSDLIGRVADRFETAYVQLCADLNCSLDPADASSNMPAIKLFVRPDADQATWAFADQRILITLPSPRITGMFDTVDNTVAHQLDDPAIDAAYDSLLPPLAQMMSGGFPRWTLAPNQRGWFFPGGWTFLQAVIAWESNRVSNHPNIARLIPPPQLANNTQFVQLESLWAGQTAPSNPEQVASSVVVFIEQKFDASSVGKFLKAIGPAHSFTQAIEASLGIDAAEFERQWKDWLRQFYASARE